MQSLSQLNGRSTTELTVTDTRLATVNFDRLEPSLQPITITGLVYPAIPVGIEIAEIVNYDITDCTVKFSIISLAGNVLTGSTLAWNAIPEGITLTTSGQEYTLTGFSKISQWNQIKNPIWNIPSTYTTKRPFFVKVEIFYFDQATNLTKVKSYNVFDPLYYYEVTFAGEFALAFDITKLRPGAAALTSAFTLISRRDVELRTNFVLTAAVEDVKFAAAVLPTSTATFTCNVEALQAVSNAALTRTYVANKESQPFLTNPPQITDPRSGTYTVVLTATNAQFSQNTTSSSASLTLTGSKATVNSQIASVYFMPDWNVLSNLSITWTQKYNGTTYATRTIATNYGSNNNDVKRVNFTTSGNHSYTPTFLEKKYCQIVRTMIGGGGSAGAYAGGNAGTITAQGDTTPLNSYSFVVGGPGQNTVYNYTGGSLISAAGTTATETITYKFSNYYGAPASPDPLIFTKGYGGKNGYGGYGTALPSGLISTGLSSTRVGNNVYVYRTEYGGQGGSAAQSFDYSFGRGGNGVVVRTGNPVTHYHISSNTTYYFYITISSSGQTSSPLPWGNGGDAPGGTGQSGAVMLYISRRLNANGT